MRSLSVLFAAALVLSSVVAQEVPPPARYRPVRDTIVEALNTGKVPAMSVAVLERGELVWARGYGFADMQRRTRAGANTIYRLASISKPFTATALAVLAERGAVDLDAPVNRYLEAPGVRAHRGEAADITVRRLGNHTAGLPTHWSFFYGDDTPPPRAETIRRYGFAAWRPGTRTNYSNLAFGILDHVIARVSGATYREFLVGAVLDPLGMSDTDVGVRPGREAQAAVAYRGGDGLFRPVVDYGFDHDGASAVRSSVLDLMQFARLQIGEGAVGGARVLSAEAARAMRQRRGRNAGSGFGLGWAVDATRRATVLRHTGGMPGVSTSLQVFPAQGSAVAVLCNTANRKLVTEVMNATVEIVLRDVIPERRPMLGTPGPVAPAPAQHRAAPEGHFVGIVRHHAGNIPLELEFGSDGSVRAVMAGAEVAGVTGVEIDVRRLRLRFRAPLPTTASMRGVPSLALELERAPAKGPDGWRGLLYASGRDTMKLPHWVELERRPR